MNYNPYDLIEIIVNGQKQYARPCEWSGEIVDKENCTDAFGAAVIPIKLSGICPDCGRGMLVDIVSPFGTHEFKCECRKLIEEKASADPFVNPIISKIVKIGNLDDLMSNPIPIVENDVIEFNDVKVCNTNFEAQVISALSEFDNVDLIEILDKGEKEEFKNDFDDLAEE